MRFAIASVALLTLVAAAPFDDFIEKATYGANSVIEKRQSACNPGFSPCPGISMCGQTGQVCCMGG